MAHAIQIDTLAFSKRLREAGADEALAEAIVEGITAADTSELATKADIAEVKGEIAELRSEQKQDVAGVRAEIADVRSELKQDIAGVRTEIAQLSSNLYRQLWVMGIGIVGLTFTLSKLFP